MFKAKTTRTTTTTTEKKTTFALNNKCPLGSKLLGESFLAPNCRPQAAKTTQRQKAKAKSKEKIATA